MNTKVGIVGAGPGGLMLARLLQMEGVDVSVFEREESPTARFSGGSLDMAPESGRKAIKAAGLEAAFQQLARPEGDAYTISDGAGRITFRRPALRFVSRRPEIDRAHLREMLLSSLAPDTVQWARLFVGLSDANARKRLHFEDGSTIDMDLVVGVDGARSRLRPFVTDRSPTRDCPAIQHWIRGANFSRSAAPLACSCRRSSGARSLHISQKIAKGNKLNGIDLSSRSAVPAYASEILQDWHPACIEAVEASAPLSVKPLLRTAHDQFWPPRRNVTLVGDAAYSRGTASCYSARVVEARAASRNGWRPPSEADEKEGLRGTSNVKCPQSINCCFGPDDHRVVKTSSGRRDGGPELRLTIR